MASTVRFYLSSDETFDGIDTFLKEISIDAITEGAKKSAKLNVDLNGLTVKPLPTGTRSDDFVLGVVDATGLVTESDETGNFIVFGNLE